MRVWGLGIRVQGLCEVRVLLILKVISSNNTKIENSTNSDS